MYKDESEGFSKKKMKCCLTSSRDMLFFFPEKEWEKDKEKGGECFKLRKMLLLDLLILGLCWESKELL